MIKNVENLVFVNWRKGDKIIKIKPKQELIRNRGYLNTFSQKFIYIWIIFTFIHLFQIHFIKFLKHLVSFF